MGDRCGILVIVVMAEACALGSKRVEHREFVGELEGERWIRDIESALSSPPAISSASTSD